LPVERDQTGADVFLHADAVGVRRDAQQERSPA
jgi:hypothetical protein